MFYRDTGKLARNLKGCGIFLYIFKGIQDTWINFRDMGIQCFLNFGICHINFRHGIFFSARSHSLKEVYHKTLILDISLLG